MYRNYNFFRENVIHLIVEKLYNLNDTILLQTTKLIRTFNKMTTFS